MRLLLGSGGFRTSERIAALTAQTRDFFGPVRRLLFVPHALKDHDGYVKAMVDKGLHAGYELDGLHCHADPVRAVQGAEGIYVGGGNSFRLLAELYRRDLLGVIRDRVHGGMPYLGISAGCNVACSTRPRRKRPSRPATARR